MAPTVYSDESSQLCPSCPKATHRRIFPTHQRSQRHRTNKIQPDPPTHAQGRPTIVHDEEAHAKEGGYERSRQEYDRHEADPPHQHTVSPRVPRHLYIETVRVRRYQCADHFPLRLRDDAETLPGPPGRTAG